MFISNKSKLYKHKNKLYKKIKISYVDNKKISYAHFNYNCA